MIMEKIFIENEYLKVGIKLFGAELTSVVSKESDAEYMYQPDGIHWNKQSPILFPNIGAIRENSFVYEGKSYPARKHGFARDYAFQLEEQGESFATFLLTDKMIEEEYPFKFELRLQYSLENNALQMTYSVSTTSPELYFAIGGHPAFAVPLEEGLTFEDYHNSFRETFAQNGQNPDEFYFTGNIIYYDTAKGTYAISKVEMHN